MYVTRVPNRTSPPAVLLRESYREDGKVKNRTLANLSALAGSQGRDAAAGAARRQAGAGRRGARDPPLAAARSRRRRPRRRPPDRPRPSAAAAAPSARHLVLALIVARLIEPAAKLATARAARCRYGEPSLGAALGLGERHRQRDLRGARLARLASTKRSRASSRAAISTEGTLVLYDVTSTYLEGRCCPLARHGYSRDSRRDKLQIVFGLLCASDGCPVAVEVFEGNTGDPATLATADRQAEAALRPEARRAGRRPRHDHRARIEKDLQPAGLDWITALRAPAIQALADEGGPLATLAVRRARSGRDQLARTIPVERLVVCRNPRSPRSAPASAASCSTPPRRDLPRIQARVDARPQPAARRGRDRRSRSVPCSIGARWPSTSLTITDDDFSFTRKQAGDRRRGQARRLLCAAHRLGRDSRCRRHRARLQEPRQVERAFRSTQDRRSRESGRSSTCRPTGCAPMSSCACSPTTSNGTCARRWRPSCSTITTAPPRQAQHGLHRSPPRRSRRRLAARPRPSAPTTACRCTASAPCLPTSPP